MRVNESSLHRCRVPRGMRCSGAAGTTLTQTLGTNCDMHSAELRTYCKGRKFSVVNKSRYEQILAVWWEFILGTLSHSLHAIHVLIHVIVLV